MSKKLAPLPANAAGFQSDADDVFGRIASRYDLLCDLFSFGLHRLWKRRVVDIIVSEPWTALLDVAAGTGDVALRVARRQGLNPGQRILTSDINPQMLALARKRAEASDAAMEFKVLDAHDLADVPTASVDLYSMSFGLKICDRHQAIREAYRVLKPGGRLVTLEASDIRWSWLQAAYRRYMALCVPLIGMVATGGDASAYRYLLKGILEFPGADVLAAELAQAGFEQISFERLSLGIVAIHVGRKPVR